MAEPGRLDSDRLALVGQLAESMYDRLVATVIDDIKALPEDCRQSGDDSSLKDVWEEFKDQLQIEQSIFFDAYEDTIQSLCLRRVTKLDNDRRCLLSLWSEGYSQLWEDEERVQLTDLEVSHVADDLYRRVCDVGANEPLAQDLENEIHGSWPGAWPGKQFVELDNVGDPGDWLETSLGEKPSVILQDLPSYEEHVSLCLAEDYLKAIDAQGFDMPWAFGGDPSDPAWIGECKGGIQQEFVAFLRHWRERSADELAKLNPPPRRAV